MVLAIQLLEYTQVETQLLTYHPASTLELLLAQLSPTHHPLPLLLLLLRLLPLALPTRHNERMLVCLTKLGQHSHTPSGQLAKSSLLQGPHTGVPQTSNRTSPTPILYAHLKIINSLTLTSRTQ